MKRLAILKCGDAAEDVRKKHGDYDAMFLAHLRDVDVTATVYDVVREAAPPPLEQLDFAIITGSPASVTEVEPWAERLAQWSREALSAELPLLGVCYGHQLLAYAAGGEVQQNPWGFELGTSRVQLTAEGLQDELLQPGASDQGKLTMQQVHGDEVAVLPKNAVRLAGNGVSEQQAFRLGSRCWGVQFHPEMTLPIMIDYIDARAELVRAGARRAGKDPETEVQLARQSLEATPEGPRLLRRFIRLAHGV